jgi:two-component system response regulator HydG
MNEPVGASNRSHVPETRRAPDGQADGHTAESNQSHAPAARQLPDAPYASDREPAALPALVTESPAMKRLLALIGQLAATDATVLLQGESGTGKELIARTLHARSPRGRGPFVAINCAAIPEALLESELFGHERGAFTGAAHRKPGRIEVAHGGTLFLDEVAELAPTCQAKVLRVLQERQVDRLGGVHPLPVDVRVIAASNAALKELVEHQRFREDLYYRLNVITLRVPPLRERLEDVLPLAQFFVRQHAERAGRVVHGFAAQAVEALRAHAWDGNVRELDNRVLRAVILAAGPEIEPDDLELPADGHCRAGVLEAEASPKSTTLAEIARDHLVAALERCGGRRSVAAKMLGIDRSTLWRRLRRYGLVL